MNVRRQDIRKIEEKMKTEQGRKEIEMKTKQEKKVKKTELKRKKQMQFFDQILFEMI